MPPTPRNTTSAAIVMELKLESIIEILFEYLTPEWFATAVFNLILIVIFYVLSKIGKRSASGSGDKCAAYDPRAGITIINNVRCCRARTRRRAAIRRRKARYARRKPLRRRKAGDDREV